MLPPDNNKKRTPPTIFQYCLGPNRFLIVLVLNWPDLKRVLGAQRFGRISLVLVRIHFIWGKRFSDYQTLFEAHVYNSFTLQVPSLVGGSELDPASKAHFPQLSRSGGPSQSSAEKPLDIESLEVPPKLAGQLLHAPDPPADGRDAQGLKL